MPDVKELLTEIFVEKIEQRIVGKLAKHYGQVIDNQIESPFVRVLRRADEKQGGKKNEGED